MNTKAAVPGLYPSPGRHPHTQRGGFCSPSGAYKSRKYHLTSLRPFFDLLYHLCVPGIVATRNQLVLFRTYLSICYNLSYNCVLRTFSVHIRTVILIYLASVLWWNMYQFMPDVISREAGFGSASGSSVTQSCSLTLTLLIHFGWYLGHLFFAVVHF
jgi:hypothetical protein